MKRVGNEYLVRKQLYCSDRASIKGFIHRGQQIRKERVCHGPVPYGATLRLIGHNHSVMDCIQAADGRIRKQASAYDREPAGEDD
jgi:hypothetical protein